MINVMTYDMYGSWTNKIGHHSALFHRRGEKGMERDLNTVRLNEEDLVILLG
jgi:GH18 family chitinase